MSDGSINDFGGGTSNKTNRCPPIEAAQPRKGYDEEEAEDELKDNSKEMWSCLSHGKYMAVSKTIKPLPPGLYTLMLKQWGLQFECKNINVDDLLQFPESKSDRILKEIEHFWNRGEFFKKYGFLHRRGYMFYGPAGSGKTALVQLIISNILKNGGIVFNCGNPDLLDYGLQIFREIEPNRQIVCLFEDIDAIIERYGDSDLLSILDGENQVDKVLNIATTNYPELLDPRIVSRPRRFDRLIHIGMPSDKVRRDYFHRKLQIEKKELDKWVESTDSFSFAACAELVISVKCLGKKFDESVKILKNLMTHKASSKDYSNTQKTGFGLVSEIDESDSFEEI